VHTQFPAPGLDRRALLRSTAGLGGVAWLLGGVSACSQSPPLRPAGVRALSDEQAHTMTQLIDAVVPRGPDFSPPEVSVVLQQIDAFLRFEPAPIRKKLQDALLLLEWAPVFSFRFKPFSALSRGERQAVFGRFGVSGWGLKRAIYIAFKGLILFQLADDPQLWPHLGYDGPWVATGEAKP